MRFVAASARHPLRATRSYATGYESREGGIFFVINLVGNFHGTVYMTMDTGTRLAQLRLYMLFLDMSWAATCYSLAFVLLPWVLQL